MKSRILGRFGLVAALLTGAGLASAGTAPQAITPSDEALAQKVRHEIVMYPHYTIWDNINLRVNNGNVELTGAVSQPYKKSEIGKIVQKVRGPAGTVVHLRILRAGDPKPLEFTVTRAKVEVPDVTWHARPGVAIAHVAIRNFGQKADEQPVQHVSLPDDHARHSERARRQRTGDARHIEPAMHDGGTMA